MSHPNDHSATYSPDDNKIRLYALHRLDPDTYARAKAAGFRWAPKQDLFFATWSPEAEDFALELAGEIGDEDTSLVDRAEERADRFDGYRENRTKDATQAERAVSQIADGIPLGQPILVGHHSERRARKDAERIQRGMDKAVRMWQTAGYWRARAAGALRHAKYKERPDVRARRIKTIEAEERKEQRRRDMAGMWLKAWNTPDLTDTQAQLLAGRSHLTVIGPTPDRTYGWSAWDVLKPDADRSRDCPAWTVAQVQERAREVYAAQIAVCDRWLAHLAHRLSYERAMLAESGYTPPPKPKTKAALPLLNYGGTIAYRNPYQRGEIVRGEAVGLTKAELAAIHTDYKGTNVSECGTHRIRTAIVTRDGRRGLHAVYLTDSKQHPKPSTYAVALQAAEDAQAEESAVRARLKRIETTTPAPATPEADKARALKTAGPVQVVSAPDLFPTPPTLAERMVALAGLMPGQRILEPSAGTGRLLWPALAALQGNGGELVAVEIGVTLADRLRDHHRELVHSIHANEGDVSVRCADFLTCNGDLGTFDRIIMNPPFSGGADIEHILHALTFLKPGGRLVALCANGPRQANTLRPLAETWEDLPAGTFAGTNVRAALLTMTNKAEA